VLKRNIALVLALLLAAVLQLSGYAASLPKIGDIHYGAWEDAQAKMESAAYLNGAQVEDLTDLPLGADDELRIYLSADLFVDESGSPIGDATEGITLSQLRNGSVSIEENVRSGSSLIEEISLDYDRSAGPSGGTSYIKITLVEDFVSVNDEELSCTLQLRIKGGARSETAFEIAGVMENPRISVMQGEEYVDISDGSVAKAEGSYSGCILDLGNNVTVTVNPVEKREYYGVARIKDDANVEQDQNIRLCYVIKQVNLDDAGHLYHFSLPSLYYVYDAQGDYLGTSGEELPYSSRYYLTAKEVEFLDLV